MDTQWINQNPDLRQINYSEIGLMSVNKTKEQITKPLQDCFLSHRNNNYVHLLIFRRKKERLNTVAKIIAFHTNSQHQNL